MNEYISKYSDLGDFNENKIIIFIQMIFHMLD